MLSLVRLSRPVNAVRGLIAASRSAGASHFQRAAAPPARRREFVAFISSSPVLLAASNVTMAASLQSSKIIPDLIDRVADSAQQVEIHVRFGDVEAKDGVLIAPAKAAHTPKVQINGMQESLYSLISSDPDPPDPANPVKKEWLHWLVTNIKENNVSTGNELASYMGPAPPIGTHRYTFMLFKQQEPIKAEDPTGGKRAHFNTRDFAKKYNLGDPVAVAYFNSHK